MANFEKYASEELETLISLVKEKINEAISLDEIKELRQELSFYEEELYFDGQAEEDINWSLRAEKYGYFGMDEELRSGGIFC